MESSFKRAGSSSFIASRASSALLLIAAWTGMRMSTASPGLTRAGSDGFFGTMVLARNWPYSITAGGAEPFIVEINMKHFEQWVWEEVFLGRHNVDCDRFVAAIISLFQGHIDGEVVEVLDAGLVEVGMVYGILTLTRLREACSPRCGLGQR